MDEATRAVVPPIRLVPPASGDGLRAAYGHIFDHCERVASYSMAVAEALRLDEAGVATICLGAFLHDIGKIRVPAEILKKPGRLTRVEYEVVRMHPIWGLELLEGVEFRWDIKPIVRWHHESYDGTGYPDGLHGDQIPRAAMVIGIADVYDALTSERAYHPAMSAADAMAAMHRSRRRWSAEEYEAFCAALFPQASRLRAGIRAPQVATRTYAEAI